MDTDTEVSQHPSDNKKNFKYLSYLSLVALGVVYGDIGTSPLYAVKECFYGTHAIKSDLPNVLGVLSLIFWSLIFIVTIKYIILMMRADNEGEGGILALMELVRPKRKGFSSAIIISLGLFGAALLYGDGIITPAISVLSAMEGLTIATPLFEPLIIPLTLLILFLLFYFQKRGTARIGIIFGPVMLLWFLVLAILGFSQIIFTPVVLTAINPLYGINFFLNNGFHAFITLGFVFLVVTGGEALYADMGHFGPIPIRLAWYFIVLPSLVINYFGQGALLINHPEAAVNPFYLLAPEWALYPLVILSTVATVIASQAVISGAFSITKQALQLGYLPRVRILHTSESEKGQIYIPHLNWILFIATFLLVIEFKSSSNLAAAYGVAVTTTMVITTILAFIAMRKLWKWILPIALLTAFLMLIIDLAFWSATMLKIFQGGWVPLAIGLFIYIMMTTWNWGRNQLQKIIHDETESIDRFITEFLSTRMLTIPGTAIYMSSNPNGTPPALVHNIKHNKILHKQVILLTIIFRNVPHVNIEEHMKISEPTEGFYKVVAYYGFMDNANIQQIVDILNKHNLNIKIEKTTFFLGRETLVIKKKSGFLGFRKRLFSLMSHNSQRATEYFNIPVNRVFEIGAQVEL